MTDTAVKKLSPKPGERIDISDGMVPGLILRASGKERKAWSMIYRVHGRQRRKTLGYYPNMKLADARAEASQIYSKARMGIDHFALKDGFNHEIKFSDLYDKFMDGHASGLKKEKYIKGLLEVHVLPRWKDLPIQDITRIKARALLKAVEPKDPETGRGGLHAARDVRKWAARVFTWGIDEGIVDLNPFDRVSAPGKGKVFPRDRVLKMDEIRTVWAAAGNIGDPFGPMYQLLILTGQRLREIGHAQRSWLDEDRKELIIPASFYKMTRPHVVPLSEKAFEIIQKLPRWNAGDFLFSSTGGKTPVSGFSRSREILGRDVLKLIRENDPDADPFPRWIVHDIRRTVRTELSRLGVDRDTAELVIGHAPKGVHGTYDRYDRIKERRQALELWAKEVLG
ncbi:MAG: tyrosine-type recombinase/integrase [Proteobacteria bacterium]|nr:tyrosine-type recombinase/integrase [Pseudomonadota bacterium]